MKLLHTKRWSCAYWYFKLIIFCIISLLVSCSHNKFVSIWYPCAEGRASSVIVTSTNSYRVRCARWYDIPWLFSALGSYHNNDTLENILIKNNTTSSPKMADPQLIRRRHRKEEMGVGGAFRWQLQMSTAHGLRRAGWSTNLWSGILWYVISKLFFQFFESIL